MNSIDYYNYISFHKREVIKLIDSGEMVMGKKMKLRNYVHLLEEILDGVSSRITIQFIQDVTNKPAHNTIGSDQESDCLTVGDYKHSRAD